MGGLFFETFHILYKIFFPLLSFCRSVMQFQSNVTYARASSFHSASGSVAFNDDVIKWKHFPRYWPFVRGIHRSPVNSPHKGQWHGALMFCLICAWTRGWVNNRDTCVLRRHCGHYSVTVMWQIHFVVRCRINETLRITLWNKINAIDSGFAYLDDKDKFCYLMSCCDRNILSWFGKFVYQSFDIRNQKIYGFA